MKAPAFVRSHLFIGESQFTVQSEGYWNEKLTEAKALTPALDFPDAVAATTIIAPSQHAARRIAETREFVAEVILIILH
jgi:hypothetical protein